MSEVRISDKDDIKRNVLKNSGIDIKERFVGRRTVYEVSLIGLPNADQCFETTFISLNDILIAFKDVLYKQHYRVIAV